MKLTPFRRAHPRPVRHVALVGWCVLAVSCASPRTVPTPPPASVVAAGPDERSTENLAQAVLEAHNAERARRNLTPLVLSSALTQAAEVQAADMARRGKMAHRGGDGSSPFDRIERTGYTFQAAGENVAAGFDRVDAVMAGWMRSPGHRRNILGKFREIGVGRVISPAGVTYWCVTFSTRSTS